MLRAGELRHRVTIQERTTEQAPTGELLRVWRDKRTVWSSVEPKVGKEQTASVGARTLTLFKMRYTTDVTPASRLIWDGRVFDVVSATDEKGLKTALHVMAYEIVGATP